MDDSIVAFANRLRARAGWLGAGDSVEWRFSPGLVPYETAVSEMEERAAAIGAGQVPELIWFLEHPPMYTAGTSAKASDLLDAGALPVHRTGRGGQYTYHGPGQLVAYVMLDLNRNGRDVRRHVERLEAWVIAVLGDYDVRGESIAGRPGVWVKSHDHDAKIAAIGVRVRRWVTYHGVAVNICPDLSHFEGIVPCGIADAGVTSLAAIRARIEASGRE